MMDTAKKILIIDDDEKTTEHLSRILVNAGYETNIINMPVQVHDQIKQYMPDLVILDLNMPGENGSYISARMSQDKVTRDIPTIILSGLLTEYDTFMGNDPQQKTKLMTKPVDKEKLLDTIRAILKV